MSAEHLLAEIAPILHALTDPAGGDVNEATKSLHQLVIAEPGKTLVLLAQIGAQGVGGFQSDARMISLLSLNRLMFKTMDGLYLNPQERVASTPWYAVHETMRVKIEDALCHGLKDEMDMKVRKSIALCAAKWAEESQKKQRPFVQLPSVVVSLTISTQTWHRFTAYQILANCPQLLHMGNASESMDSADISEIILGGFTDHSVDTKIQALKAMSRMMIYNGDVIHGVTSHRPLLISQAFGCITMIPWHARDVGLEHLAELAGEKPSLFVGQLDKIVEYLLSQMAPDALGLYEFSHVKRDGDYDRTNWQDVGTQSSELILALIEGYPEEFLKPDRKSTLKDIIGSYLGAQIIAFTGQDDIKEWSEADPDEEEDYPEYPEEAISRLSEALQSEVVWLIIVDHARRLSTNPDWRARYCSIIILACVVSGCRKFIQLKPLLSGIDSARTDVDPRVRCAWLELCSQLAFNLDGELQKNFLNLSVKACRTLLDDPLARVQTSAARTLLAILQPMYAEYAGQLKDREGLVDILFVTHDRGPAYVQIDAMKALSTLAELLGPKCETLYRPWMDKLLSILAAEGSVETKGPAIENATILISLVGSKTGVKDLLQLGPIMLHYHNSIDETGEEWPPLLHSWERLASALGDDFAPMLPTVMPRIMTTASMPPEDDADPWNCSDESKSKAEALLAIWFYARHVPAGFAQYIEPVWTLTIGSLNIVFPCEVKKAAFNLIPLLLQQLKTTQGCPPHVVESAWKDILRVAVPIMRDEHEFSATTACFVALREVTRVLCAPPPVDSASIIFMYANLRIEEVSSIRDQRAEDKAQYPDEELDASDEWAEEEELLLDIERACRILKEYLINVPEVQAAYQTIYDSVGDLVDGQWSI